MTRDEFNNHLSKIIAENLKINSKAIEDRLASGISADKSSTEVQALLVMNALKFSVEFSTKLIFEILNQLNVLPFEEVELRNVKPDLRIVPPLPED